MPGIPHDPKADVQLIRSILRSGYEDGFPVLKELLQNADDAGGGDPEASASTVVILLAPCGLPEATHSLLCLRPALCVLNDGDFRKTDARCLPMLGLSNKATERMSVGKFGIGLKTVFYLTDAFIFFCHQQRHWSEEEKACNLVNPWAEKHRPSWEEDWKNTAEHERQRLQCLAKGALGSDRFVGIWIPLRRHSDAQPEVIHNQYPGESFDGIFGEQWAQRLIEFAPLLRHVRTISARTLMPGGSCEELFRIEPRLGANCQFIQLRNSELHGELELKCGQNIPHAVCFHGVESLGNAELTRLFQGATNWPKQAAFDETVDLPERATPHGAVVFTRRPARKGGGRVQVQHAIFLPLGEGDLAPLPGNWDYSVFLHGFYFVDSSRRKIEMFDPQFDCRQDDTLSGLSEPELRRAWNCRLTAEMVCPEFVPALAGFVARIEATTDEVSALVRSLAKSEVLKCYGQWLYARCQFLFRLDHDGGAWKTESAQLPVYTIATPSFPYQRLLAAFPSLEAIAMRHLVSLNEKPLLSSKRPTPLPDDLLAEMLVGVSGHIFEDRDECKYLLDLIPMDLAACAQDSALKGALVRLANELVTCRLPEDQELRALWKEFFQRLPAAAIVCLPCASGDVVSEVAASLVDPSIPVALLWEDFRGREGKGIIPWPILLALLKRLGGLALEGEAGVKQRSRIVVRLLKTCALLPQNWGDVTGRLALFHARPPDGPSRAETAEDLRTAYSEGRLFTGADGWAKDLIRAAPTLRLLLTTEDVAQAVQLPLRNCEADSSIALLEGAASLALNFAARKPMFERLLPVAGRAHPGSWKALRCLLHGSVSQWRVAAPLFRETGEQPVFVTLARKTLAVTDGSWRLIPASVVAQVALNEEHQNQLDLRSTSATHVEGLVKEIGPEKVDCADLSREGCDVLLLQFNDLGVLRGLNIHETMGQDPCRVRIEAHTYVDDGRFADLPPEFDHLLTRIRPNSAYARFTAPELVPTLGWEAVIRSAFKHPAPELYSDTILTALGRLGTLETKLKALVFESRWLKMADGTLVAPSVLLHVPGAETELDQLPAKVLCGRVPLQRLDHVLRRHERFETFKQTVLPTTERALEAVASLLQPHTAYRTGLSGEWSPDETGDWIEALADVSADALPLAKLAKAFSGHEQVRDFLPKFLGRLAGKLEATPYTATLKHLAGGYENADAGKRIVWLRMMARYLRSIGEGGVDFARGILGAAEMKLVSAEGRTKVPGELTFADASIHLADQLDQTLSHTLEYLKPPRFVLQEMQDAPREAHAPSTNEQVRELRAYFAPWRTAMTAPDPIGALLCLLGSGPVQPGLSAEFFSAWSPDKVLDWIDEHDEAGPDLGSIRDRIRRRLFKVSIVEDTQALVRSVLGNEFRARLAIRPSSLLIGYEGDGIEVWQEGGWVICHLRLRKLPIDRENLADEVLVGLLRETASKILSQPLRAVVDVGPLFEKLAEAMQLHVRVAQNMIVEQALAFLRQIGAQEHPKIRIALAKWDDARRQEAVEEAHKLNSRGSSELRREARESIRNLLSSETDVQATVLRGVQLKLSEFQYSASSVPFELWQNADDAVAELARLGIDPQLAANLGFVSNKAKDSLLFFHWGRPLNEFAGPGGRNCRDSGFDRDVEKMLVPAISDKSVAMRHGGVAVTGKFGLGFKSVFLASDAPEILSANMDFVIRGGIYPVRLEDSHRDQLLGALHAIAPNDARRGTVIRLPLPADGTTNADEVMRLFRILAPILVIFARQLKRLRILEDDNVQRELHWQPQPLLGGQCEFGKLSEAVAKVTSALTLFSAAEVGEDRLTFLLGLNHDGFAPWPSHVPVFWVTAPTRDTPGYGFAVNGPFEPNSGRVQLALESEKNERLAKALSEVVGARLSALWNRAAAEWETFRMELNFGSGVSCNLLWESLWQVLGVHFSEKCRKDDKTVVAELARSILWSSDAAGMRHFYAACAALPTGLWGEHRALTKLGDVHFIASGALDRELVFRTVLEWKEFKKRAAVGAICSGSQVASVLERLGAPLREPETVRLATVVEWELGKEKRADPELAAHLGAIITPEFIAGLEKGQANEREENEHGRLVELLRDVLFQAAEGSWHKAGKLLVAAPQDCVGKDEPMWAAFAPRHCQLNSAYVGASLQFFLASRGRLETSVDQMADWVLKSDGQTTRVAALRYLLNGELKDLLAVAVRQKRDEGNWLWQLQGQPWYETEFTAAERLELEAYVLRLFHEKLQEQTGPPPPPRPPPPKHIWTVKELWRWWEQQHKPTNDYTLEGEPNWPLFHGGPIGSEEERKDELKRLLRSVENPLADAKGNALWYKLFGYACLLSTGRHTTELRRFWTARLNPQSFWERSFNGNFSDETKEIFEQAVTAEFTDLIAGGEQAYFWRRVFYDIRKIHRMVKDNRFPADLMRLVAEGHGPHLPNFLRTGSLPGLNQQHWVGTFGQSAGSPLFFVIRELVRLGVIKDKAVEPLAFFVSTPVRRALRKIGWMDEDDNGTPDFQELAYLSQWLHDKLIHDDPHFGPLFLQDFDIPLLHMGITHRGRSLPVPPE